MTIIENKEMTFEQVEALIKVSQDEYFLINEFDEGYSAVAFGVESVLWYWGREISALSYSTNESMEPYIFELEAARQRIAEDPHLSNLALVLEVADVVAMFDVGPQRTVVFKRR